MTTLHLKKSISGSPLRLRLLLIPLVFACLALSPMTQAVTPPPDGGYPGGNTAEGTVALQNLTSGTDNTAIGRRALFANREGKSNTAIGAAALDANISGDRNTATGVEALSGSKGSDNTANGFQALFNLTTGNSNTAVGSLALGNLRTGNSNIGIGYRSGRSLFTGNNNIYVANDGVDMDSNTIRVGGSSQSRSFITGISGVAVAPGLPVNVNAGGQLGTAPSSQRFKDEIKAMDQMSEAILALKPVTFRYKKEIDPERTPQFGLVAEDVQKVDPDLVMRDKDGKPYSVRYEAVNAMLLNEFLKAHRKIEKHGATIVRQQEQIDALAAGLQKVSTQLEVSKPAPQTVLNGAASAEHVENHR